MNIKKNLIYQNKKNLLYDIISNFDRSSSCLTHHRNVYTHMHKVLFAEYESTLGFSSAMGLKDDNQLDSLSNPIDTDYPRTADLPFF